MNGVAFDRARRRVQTALRAGSLNIESERAGAHRVDGDLIVALHAGLPVDALRDWLGELSIRSIQAVADGADPVAAVAGAYTQGMLTGLFFAEELAKDAER